MRLGGIDAARGLAFAGMVVAHYLASTHASDPGWLQAVEKVADGRAAPLFCLILGVGAGLAMRRVGRTALVRRAFVLFVVGLALWPLIDRVYLILPHYGLLLGIVVLCAGLSNRMLLAVTAVSFIIPSVVVAFADRHNLRRPDEPDGYADLLAFGDVVWQVLWSGAYPVAGWTGFALLGLWLSRQRLADRDVQFMLLGGGIAIAGLQPFVAIGMHAMGDVTASRNARGVATFLDASAHSNQTAWYVIAAATSLAIIGASLIAQRVKPVEWLADLGRLALTVYLLHLLIGARLVWPWRDSAAPSLGLQTVVASTIVVLFAVASRLWSYRFRRGPAEAVIRAMSLTTEPAASISSDGVERARTMRHWPRRSLERRGHSDEPAERTSDRRKERRV